jgi:hypothetical protein
MYRTCTYACLKAINHAYSMTCNQKSVDHCKQTQQSKCDETCLPKKDVQPIPKIHRHCILGCQTSLTNACAQGSAKLDLVVDADWMMMKQVANPHLDMTEL